MIVQPDFPDHWKTRLLVEITGDPAAPLAVIRLWAHCQNCKRGEFSNMTPAILASVCHWQNSKVKCHVALIQAGFIKKIPSGGFAVHQWAEHNAKLIANWENGAKGGRPPKGTEGANSLDSDVTQRKPTGNPSETDRSDPTERSDRSDPKVPKPLHDFQKMRQATEGGAEGSLAVALAVGGMERAEERNGISVPDKSMRAQSLPTLNDVERTLRLYGNWAVKWAKPTWSALKKSKMRGNDGAPIRDLQAWVRSYADACESNERKVPQP